MAMAECRNASNPYHECSGYCAEWIAKNKAQQQHPAPAGPAEEGMVGFMDGLRKPRTNAEQEMDGDFHGDKRKREVEEAPEAQVAEETQQEEEGEPENLTERQKKLRLLQRKLADARRANQSAVVMEKRREEAPKEARGMSKQKWFDEKQKTVEKRLEHGGLDKSKVYMLETQEAAEAKYEKSDKEPAAFGWDVFNQRSLYRAYKKRTKDIPYTVEDYAKAKEADPDFYRDETSLQYGKSTTIPHENVNKMVEELEQRRSKRKDFSRRRKYHEEKDIDSINDRNEHFNRKIERAFGKYTVEIKNNLERGTALPD